MTRTPARVTPQRGVKYRLVYRERFSPAIDQKDRAGSAISPGDPVIYVVGFAGYVKIGFTRNIAARLRMIQSHAPEAIEVYVCYHGTQAEEQRLLCMFPEQHLRGEWFSKTGKLANWIASLQKRARVA